MWDLLSAIIYMAVCVAVFDQFMFRLHMEIIEFDWVWLFIRFLVEVVQVPCPCLLGQVWTEGSFQVHGC